MERTWDEINRQIEGLQNMKTYLPEVNFFGCNNWESIDAQITVLKGEEDAEFFYVDEAGEQYDESDNDIWRDAQRAEQWLEGDETEDLFETQTT